MLDPVRVHPWEQRALPRDLSQKPGAISRPPLPASRRRLGARETDLVKQQDTPSRDLDWELELQKFVRLRAICLTPDVDFQKNQLRFVHSATHSLLRNSQAPSRNGAILAQLFSRGSCRDAFLCRSHLFEHVRGNTRPITNPPDPVHQLSAQLHCLCGPRVLTLENPGFAAARVYDCRRYERRLLWGPYLDEYGGMVDWEKLEAVLINIGHHLMRRRVMLWATPFEGVSPDSFSAPMLREPTPAELQDPYGVTGTWLRVRRSILFSFHAECIHVDAY